MKNQIGAVFVGDANSGKSSIISCILSGGEIQDVPSVLEPAFCETEFTNNLFRFMLVDTSSKEEEKEKMCDKIKQADVVILVYAADSESSIECIRNKWLPLVLLHTPTVPVILVGNKADQVKDMEPVKMKCRELISLYENVETCLECSIMNPKSLTQILNFAQKAVVFPTDPLLDRHTQTLTDPFLRALKRIFRIFDSDWDRTLSDEELNHFQSHCYGEDLSAEEIANLKGVLHEKGGDEYVTISGTGSITESGFCYLMQMFIMYDHPETSWMALRAHNYSDQVELDLSQIRVDVPRDSSVELGNRGRFFLTNLFRSYDTNHDGSLSATELQSLFSPLPDSRALWQVLASMGNLFMLPICPGGSLVNERGELTLTGWLTQWAIMLRTNPEISLRTMVLLGYNEDISNAYTMTMAKNENWKESMLLDRSVVHAFVFGDKAVGKTALCRRLLGAPLSVSYVPTTALSTVGAPVRMRSTKQRENTLILTEVPASSIKTAISEYIGYCDIACLVFDVNNIESFNYLISVQQQLPPSMKQLFIAFKNDKLDRAYEETEICELARKHLESQKLDLPLLTSHRARDRLFTVVFDCAVTQGIAEPEVAMVKHVKGTSFWKYSRLLTFVGCICGGLWYYFVHSKHPIPDVASIFQNFKDGLKKKT